MENRHMKVEARFLCFCFVFNQFQRERRDGKKEGEKCQCERGTSIALHTRPHQGLNLQPRHVPGLGIELTEPHRPGPNERLKKKRKD